MSKTEKQYARLDRLEEEFRRDLERQLKLEAEGKTSLLFFISTFANHKNELYEFAQEILKLRRQLEQPVADCLAARFCELCEQHSNFKDAHRKGGKRLASELLEELHKR